MKKIVLVLMGVAMLASCSHQKQQGDRLRDEIDERREALVERQEEGLRQAEDELAQVDTLLEAAKQEHDSLHAWVMAHATTLSDQSPQVLRLNRVRAIRDSLQERFDVLCQKIKYIHKKQKE